jgi:hypothetical protein
VHNALGNADDVFRCLERALADRTGYYAWFGLNSQTHRFAGDQRVVALDRRYTEAARAGPTIG